MFYNTELKQLIQKKNNNNLHKTIKNNQKDKSEVSKFNCYSYKASIFASFKKVIKKETSF